MKYYCSLRIDAKQEIYNIISKILKYDIIDYNKGWMYEIELSENYYKAIDNFLDNLELKAEKLKELGIETDAISIWLLCEYNNQCNLEFDPNILFRLSKNKIRLCISCYEE